MFSYEIVTGSDAYLTWKWEKGHIGEQKGNFWGKSCYSAIQREYPHESSLDTLILYILWILDRVRTDLQSSIGIPKHFHIFTLGSCAQLINSWYGYEHDRVGSNLFHSFVIFYSQINAWDWLTPFISRVTWFGIRLQLKPCIWKSTVTLQTMRIILFSAGKCTYHVQISFITLWNEAVESL